MATEEKKGREIRSKDGGKRGKRAGKRKKERERKKIIMRTEIEESKGKRKNFSDKGNKKGKGMYDDKEMMR